MEICYISIIYYITERTVINIFNNKRFITCGVNAEIEPLLQILMWNLIDQMPVSKKDYLQVFSLSETDGKLKVIHTQEEPQYEKEYVFNLKPITAKIFVIDDDTHSTLLMNFEY